MASRESRVRRDLSVLDGEAWSWRRHADVCLLPRCGDFRSLKRFDARTAAALDEGKSGNLQRQNALLHHMYVFRESASQDPSHETEWGWPILGIQDPEGRLLPPWASEQSAVVACHKERVALDAARKSIGRLCIDSFRDKRVGCRPLRERGERSRRSSIAEMRKAKGRVARKASKARGDQVRQGPARASSGASPARLLKEPVSGRLGGSFSLLS